MTKQLELELVPMNENEHQFQLDIDTFSHLDYFYLNDKKDKKYIANLIVECANIIDNIREQHDKNKRFDCAMEVVE